MRKPQAWWLGPGSSPTYPKVLSNFKAIGRCNPPQAAKFEGGVSKPEVAEGMPRKRHNNGVPRKKARGGEDPFLFRVDREPTTRALTETRPRQALRGACTQRASPLTTTRQRPLPQGMCT